MHHGGDRRREPALDGGPVEQVDGQVGCACELLQGVVITVGPDHGNADGMEVLSEALHASAANTQQQPGGAL